MYVCTVATAAGLTPFSSLPRFLFNTRLLSASSPTSPSVARHAVVQRPTSSQFIPNPARAPPGQDQRSERHAVQHVPASTTSPSQRDKVAYYRSTHHCSAVHAAETEDLCLRELAESGRAMQRVERVGAGGSGRSDNSLSHPTTARQHAASPTTPQLFRPQHHPSLPSLSPTPPNLSSPSSSSTSDRRLQSLTNHLKPVKMSGQEAV